MAGHLDEILHTTFPDKPDVAWKLLGFGHRADLLLAEVEPRSDEVGYPRFQLGFLPAGEHRAPVATWCLEGGSYTPLATARGAPKGLPRVLDLATRKAGPAQDRLRSTSSTSQPSPSRVSASARASDSDGAATSSQRERGFPHCLRRTR